MDNDGYGQRPGQTPLDRLLEDCRTLGPSGIERIAAGWEQRVPDVHREAERAALEVLESTGRGAQWDDLRNRLLGLTERGVPLLAWRAEHGDVGHSAEDALLGAALALLARPELDARRAETLVTPMASALPWLLTAAAHP
ncbi:MAG TPA: hypothetical protein VG520_06325 [Candidatus Dormibacteraeota bacterium]|nr:hypothetical protein [Candidatus Dormibacteraeota bacterium]